MQTTIEVLPDGVTSVRRSLFDDGPAKPVWITTLSLDDPATGAVQSASARKGGVYELQTERVQVTAYTGPQDWTLTYTQTGTDDDKPADIRVTETRTGDQLIEIKEVRPPGDAAAPWRFRNQTRLTRTGPFPQPTRH